MVKSTFNIGNGSVLHIENRYGNETVRLEIVGGHYPQPEPGRCGGSDPRTDSIFHADVSASQARAIASVILSAATEAKQH